MDKKSARLRRSRKARFSAKRLNKTRASVHRTNQHIYIQAISPEGAVLASASTLDKALKSKVKV
ncbi:MAG: 50S ribosomal protein L18, partial [Coxiellaceae bacterium]|nr:50S ribosomal protein L18 [Coxiellaceae bacterium]